MEVLIIVLLVLIAAAICLCFTSRIRKREDRCGAVAGAAAILYVSYWPLADMAVALLKCLFLWVERHCLRQLLGFFQLKKIRQQQGREVQHPASVRDCVRL